MEKKSLKERLQAIQVIKEKEKVKEMEKKSLKEKEKVKEMEKKSLKERL